MMSGNPCQVTKNVSDGPRRRDAAKIIAMLPDILMLLLSGYSVTRVFNLPTRYTVKV